MILVPPYIPVINEFAKLFQNESFFTLFCILSIALAGYLFYKSFKKPQNHGKLFKQENVKWGTMRSGWAFFIINIIPALVFAYNVLVYGQMTAAIEPINVPVIAYLVFRLYRAFIYPFRRSRHSKPWPIEVVLYYLGINTLLAIVEARTIMFEYWGFSGAFNYVLAGIYLIALYINVTTDFIMCAKRTGKKNGYRLLRGGLFDYVSQPNYAAEVVMWISWIMTCSFSIGTVTVIAFMFTLFIGRSKLLHKWNQEYFRTWGLKTTPIIPGFEFTVKKGDYRGIFDFMVL
jgi:protein-S-isoprenylcysteine O-methyltransferase Ste14